MPNVTLSGFPPVIQISFFQPSGSRPGRLVVDTTHDGVTSLARLPHETTLTITSTGYTGVWPEMRVVKMPRSHRMLVRTVLEDSRWKMRETKMSGTWNRRNTLGVVSTATEKTVPQLVELIADACDLPIITGSVPTYRIPASWQGMTAQQAMSQLLTIGGCRMTYDPVEQRYVVSLAGSGPNVPAAQRRFRPAPPVKIKDLVVRSAPILFEDRLPCRASQIDGNGNLVADASPDLPVTEAFTGHHKLRIWEPTDVSHPEAGLDVEDIELLPHRAASVVPVAGEPIWVPPRVFLEDWERFPIQRLPLSIEGTQAKVVSGTSGGQAILFDHPILGSDGAGGFETEGDLLCAYHVREEDGTLRRHVTQETVDASAASDLVFTFDWIKPVDSTESDLGASQWSSLQDTITNFMAARYGSPPQTVTLSQPVDLEGSGQVGATHFAASLIRRLSRFTVAVNFEPQSYAGSRLR